VRAVDVAGPLADPQEVRGGVVREGRAGVDPGQRALVVEEQGLVAGEELDALQGFEVRTAGVHEPHCAIDLPSERFIAGVRRVGHEPLVPVVDQPEVGESTLRERADQVQRRGRRVVGLHHSRGVVPTALRREVVAVDHVPPVGRQGDAVARLVVGGPRLGELAGHASHLDDGKRGTVGQDDGHLEDRTDAGTDPVRSRALERLRAVPPLQQERLALGCCGEPLTEHVHLAGEDEGREARKFPDGRRVDSRVLPRGLLHRGHRAPGIEAVGGGRRGFRGTRKDGS